jgi:hypothetical protein
MLGTNIGKELRQQTFSVLQGFRQIEAATRRQILEDGDTWRRVCWRSLVGGGGSTAARDSKFRTLRVFLGDTSAKVTVGYGGSMTVRERAIMRAEMDVRELDLL